MKRALLLASALLISLTLVATYGVLDVSAQPGGSIGIRPAHPDPKNPRSESIFISTLTPGTATKDAVTIVNDTAETKTIHLYATDAIASSGGAFACAQEAQPVTEAGKWIALASSEKVLSPYSEAAVAFTMTAPDKAESGEHNGCIVAAEKTPPATQGGVSLNFRSAVRVAMFIPGPIIKTVDSVKFSVTTSPSAVILSPTVRNSGTVSVDATVTAQLKTPLRTTREEVTSTFPVLRDQETTWNIELDRPFWGSLFIATYVLQYDASPNFLGENSDTDATIVTVHGPTRLVFIWPQPAALLVQLLVIAIITISIALPVRRIYRRYYVNKTWHIYTVKKHDRLKEIAEAHHIPWGVLARANSLKPPYDIHEGDTLKVPPKETADGTSHRKNKK